MIDDALEHIFSYIANTEDGGDSLVGCALVCKQWNRVVASDLLWRAVFHKAYPVEARWSSSKGIALY